MIVLCVATYWALRVWIGPRYAFVAALLAIVRFGLFSFWVNSYCGGAFTALGGLLLLGGYKRLVDRPAIAAGAWVGAGAFILMTTRPFEGLLFAAPFGVALIVAFVKARRQGRRPMLIAGIVASLFVAGGGALTVAHDTAVTGDWKLAPYTLYRQTTAETPPFIFERPNRGARARYPLTSIGLDEERRYYQSRPSIVDHIAAEAQRLFNYWNFYVGFALSAPFFMGLVCLRRYPVLVLASIVLLAGLAIETWDFAHYAAPAFGVFSLAIVLGLRALRRWRPRGPPIGLALSRWLPLTLTVGLWTPVSAALLGGGSFENYQRSASCCVIRTETIHQLTERLLGAVAEPNIVVVNEGPWAPRYVMLVYNEALVSKAHVIWLNEDPAMNPATIARYPGRRVWRLTWSPPGGACLRQDPRRFDPAVNLSLANSPRASKNGWGTGASDTCPDGLYHAPLPYVTRPNS
jgi:hypothetical protein